MDHDSGHCSQRARRWARIILSQSARRVGGSERGKQALHPVNRGGADGPPLCTALKWHGMGRAEFCLSRRAEWGEASEASKLRIL